MLMESRCFDHWGISSIGGVPALHAGGTGVLADLDLPRIGPPGPYPLVDLDPLDPYPLADLDPLTKLNKNITIHYFLAENDNN